MVSMFTVNTQEMVTTKGLREDLTPSVPPPAPSLQTGNAVHEGSNHVS